METFIVGIVIIGFIFSLFSSDDKKKAKKQEEANAKKRKDYNRCKQIINQHLDALAVQRRQMVVTDPYGKEILTNWETKGMKYFIDTYIYKRPVEYSDPKLRKVRYLYSGLELALSYEEIREMIEKMVKAHQLKLSEEDTYSDNLTGHQFEIFCEDKLKNEGWAVYRTKGSGDQGVDLIIKKGNRAVSVQCKKSKAAISNKAVQEVVAGMKFYNNNEGIVITNSKFTKSAISLAEVNNIRLIHYLETKNI